MSISGTPRLAGPFTADGVQTVFPFEFRVISGDAVLVLLTSVDGAQTTATSGYAVALNADQGADPGGTVTFDTAPASGTVSLTSSTPIEQPAEFSNVGAFYPQVLEDGLDRLTIIAQEHNEVLERALIFNVGEVPATIGDIAEGEFLYLVGTTFQGMAPETFAAPAAASAVAAAASAGTASAAAVAAAASAADADASASTASIAAGLSSVLNRYYDTIAAGMAAHAIGESFASDESGIMRAYVKTGAATYDVVPLAAQGEPGLNGGGAGTVTSVGIGGGASGLSSVAAVTVTGNLELTGTLAVAHGGTGGATAAAARSALGLIIGADIHPYDADLVSWSLKAIPAGVVVGTTDTQTLTAKTLGGDCVTNDTGALLATSCGYRGVPVTTATGARAIALADMGKVVMNTTGGWSIPSNASLALPVGFTCSIHNDSAVAQNLTITTDTLKHDGTTTTGTKSIPGNGTATILKLKTTTWTVIG